MEDIFQVNVNFTDDHAGDVGQEEHDGQTEDADEVGLFLLLGFFWNCGSVKDHIGKAEEDMKEEDTERSNDCGHDDSEDDGDEAKLVVDIMIDVAWKIHLFTKDMVCQDWINKGEEPN